VVGVLLVLALLIDASGNRHAYDTSTTHVDYVVVR